MAGGAAQPWLPQPPRSAGNCRVYGPGHAERLAFVRHGRSPDMTLDEVCVLLRFKDAPQAGCGEVNALLDEHIGHVATRSRGLRQPQTQLKALREQCVGARKAAHCGLLNELAQASSPAAGRPASAHVTGIHGQPGRQGRASARK